MLLKQTLYESWTLRRRRLDEPDQRLDPVFRKEQIRILDGLLKEYRGQPQANRPAQFPASVESRSRKRFPFTIRLTRPASQERQQVELRAHIRIEPVVNHMQLVDAQSDCAIPKIDFFDVFVDHPTKPAARQPVLAFEPLQEPRPANIFSRILHADLGQTFYSAAETVLSKIPSLLLMNVDPLLHKVVGLPMRYISGMFGLLSRNDERNAMDYVLSEMDRERPADLPANLPEGPKMLPAQDVVNAETLYVDQRAIMLHEYASHAGGRQRDSQALVQIVNRVAHTSANDRIIHPYERKAAAPEPGFMFYLNSLPPEEVGKFFESLGERAIDFNGRMGDSLASTLDSEMTLGDDMLKAFYFNLACASRVLHSIPLDCAERAANGTDELIRDQAAEFFARPDYRERALDRFRVELADGDPTIRATAVEMLSQMGTLDDVGLLLDVAELPSHGQRQPRERRTMVRAAAKLAGRLKVNELSTPDFDK